MDGYCLNFILVLRPLLEKCVRTVQLYALGINYL